MWIDGKTEGTKMDNLEAKRIGKEEEILSKMKERKNEIEKRKLNGGKS